ncbi:MAG: hypothetical protein J6O56_03690 [Bacilli bacterium]|nr:hypothetical protein [Bacilli bacterium]
MNSDFNILLGLYLSTSGASLLMNAYINSKKHIEIKKDCLRELKYKKGLHFETKRQLREMNYEYIFDSIDGIINSAISFKNVLFTCENILFSEEFDKLIKSVYSEIVERANQIEDEHRKTNVDMLRSIRNSLSTIPKEIDLDDENERLSIKKTKKILKLNHLNYDVEMLKYEENNDML